MLSVDDYLRRVLAGVEPLAPVRLPVDQALGLVLAEDVRTTRPSPSFDNSAMDGYAVRAADVAAFGGSVRLAVVDDIAAGSLPRVAVGPGQAARIMTGAPMPEGADCVVPIEQTDGGTQTVLIEAAPESGSCVRRMGGDLAADELAMVRGEVITARGVALLAACDRVEVLVHPRPRVSVMSTGSELVPAGSPVGFGQVVDSNGPLLVAAAVAAGAVVRRLGPVDDDAASVEAALAEAEQGADLVITSGGVSMGAYDTVKEVLTSRGGIEFVKVAMNPGMPQGCGQLGDLPIITLPGNPVSSFVSFEMFVRPVLRRMLGHRDLHRPTRTAMLSAHLSSPARKRQLARGYLIGSDDLAVEPLDGQSSHALGGLARANCLIVVPEDVSAMRAGEQVTVIDLRDQP